MAARTPTRPCKSTHLRTCCTQLEVHRTDKRLSPAKLASLRWHSHAKNVTEAVIPRTQPQPPKRKQWSNIVESCAKGPPGHQPASENGLKNAVILACIHLPCHPHSSTLTCFSASLTLQAKAAQESHSASQVIHIKHLASDHTKHDSV
jgi:hypothetical protein